MWKFAAQPDLAAIMVGSLDDPSVFALRAVLYASRGFTWDRLDPDVPKFDKLPPRRS